MGKVLGLTGDERLVVNRHGLRGYLWVVRNRLKQWLSKPAAPPVTDVESLDTWGCATPRLRAFSGDDYREQPDAKALIPVIIPGCGRDGSTLLMQLLGTSSQIAFNREGEFENRFLTYLVRWAQLLERDPVAENNSKVRNTLFHIDQPLGHLPWPDSHLLDSRVADGPLWKPCFLAAWREFSRSAAQHPTGKGAATAPVKYYAEKSSLWLSYQLAGLMPFKELYTLRDPRDVWLSVLAYNAKRGVGMFGRQPGQSDAEFLETFLGGQQGKLSYIAQLKESDIVAVVRYENLVANLPGEAKRLSDFLGVPLDAGAVEKKTKQYRYHMTSASPTASIARWKREMDPAVNEKFVTRLEPYLTKLGYAA